MQSLTAQDFLSLDISLVYWTENDTIRLLYVKSVFLKMIYYRVLGFATGCHLVVFGGVDKKKSSCMSIPFLNVVGLEVLRNGNFLSYFLILSLSPFLSLSLSLKSAFLTMMYYRVLGFATGCHLAVFGVVDKKYLLYVNPFL